MLKRQSKVLSIALIFVFCMSFMFAGFAAPQAAEAASTYYAQTVHAVTPGNWYNAGAASWNMIQITLPENSIPLSGTASVRVSLPADAAFRFDDGAVIATPVVGTAYTLGGAAAPAMTAPSTDNLVSTVSVTPVAGALVNGANTNYREWDVTVTAVAGPSAATTVVGKGLVNLYIDDVYVPSGTTSEFKASFEAAPGSAFSSADITLATVGSGNVSLSIGTVNSLSSVGGAIDTLKIKEDRPGAFSSGANSIKIKLPNGYTWRNPAAIAGALVWGDGASVPVAGDLSLADGNRTLCIRNPKATSSTSATYFTIAGLAVDIEDSIAQKGDIIVAVSGNSSSTTSELTVAKFADFSVNVEAFGDPKEVKAGRIAQEIGKVKIEEGMAGSLVPGRTITMQLTGGAKWNTMPVFDTTNSKNTVAWGTAWAAVGTNGDIIKATTAANANAATIVLKDMEVNVSPVASGDIKLIIGGTAGASGEITVAKAVPTVTASIDGTPAKIVIGQNVQLPDIVIAENMKEAISADTSTTANTLKPGYSSVIIGGNTVYYIDVDGVAGLSVAAGDIVVPASEALTVTTTGAANTLMLEFPMDVLPSIPTKVEVTEGDLVLFPDSVSRNVTADGRWCVQVTVKATSTKPSKVTFSGIKVNVSRTVPEGPMVAAVKGNSVVQTLNLFPGYSAATSVPVGTVVTPAPGDTAINGQFRIDSNIYLVNGVSKVMDAAPYIKGDRTYVPVRYLAYALGVAESDVVWDEASQKVTLTKGDNVVEMTIGSTTITVNGEDQTMDVAPEITNDRTMLPARYVAEGFGCIVGWDPGTRTVLISM